MSPRPSPAGTAPPPEVPGPLLEVSGLCVDIHGRSGRRRVVDDLSLTVDRGEVVALVGESGSGKSLTALSLARLLPRGIDVAAGSVRFDGEEVTTASDRQVRRLRGGRIGFVFQDPMSSLDPSYTVGSQMVEAIREHQRLSRSEARDHAVSLLDRVGIPDAARRIGDYPHQFSGGMAQRVMIAIAISNDPDMVIADEPTTALDATIQAQVLALLRSLSDERSMALVLISHDLDVVAAYADRVAVMYAGQVVEQGTAAEVVGDPEHPYTAALLGARPSRLRAGQRLAHIPGSVPPPGTLEHGCRFAPRCSFAAPVCTTADPPLVALAPGGPAGPLSGAPGRAGGPGPRWARCVRLAEIDEPAPPTPPDAPPPPERRAGTDEVVLKVEGLRKEFVKRSSFLNRVVHRTAAVRDVSFEVRAGETVGVVGESGAGKSTIGRLVLRLEDPTAGSVEFQGRDLLAARGGALRRLRRDLQVVFQNPYLSLDPRMRIIDVVAEPLDAQLDLRPGERRARAAAMIERVGLPTEVHDRRPHALSGGQRQRAAIARALVLQPKLVVCDEPVSALDVSTQAQVLNLLKDLQRELGMAYLFIGHDLAAVRYVSDRILVMYRGEVVEQGPADEVYASPSHDYTRTLLASTRTDRPAEELIAP